MVDAGEAKVVEGRGAQDGLDGCFGGVEGCLALLKLSEDGTQVGWQHSDTSIMEGGARPANPDHSTGGPVSGTQRPAYVAAAVVAVLAGGPAAGRPVAPAAATAIQYQAASQCPALPPPLGRVVHVATAAQLQDAVRHVASNTTILLADGTYDLAATLVFRGVRRVTLRGASGRRDAVVLRGRGMSNPAHGAVPHLVAIYDADDLTVADLTLRDAYYHLIQIHGEDGPQRSRFYNLRLVDAGEQFIKGSTDGARPDRLYADGGEVACSAFEYTDRARSGYTNGVDLLAVAGWTIRDNVFRRIRAPRGQLAGPAVLVWRNSTDTVVERNRIIDCDRGIALGLSLPDRHTRDGDRTWDHQGGVIRNNFVSRTGAGDVGISVNFARGFRILHNTVILGRTFPWTIEYRFTGSRGIAANNLTDGPILARDGGEAELRGNLTRATAAWFIAPAAGDLHLSPAAGAAVDRAVPVAGVADDIDGDVRPSGPAHDVGADERVAAAGLSGAFGRGPARLSSPRPEAIITTSASGRSRAGPGPP